MSVIAELQIEGDFILSDLLAELPDVPIQLERVIPTGERTIPFIWIHTDDPEPVAQRLREHRLVEQLTQLDTLPDRALYRIEWAEEPNSVLETLRSQRASLLDAVGAGESWGFDLRFPTHEALSAFHTRCEDAGLSISLKRVYRPNDEGTPARYGLTDVQRDTLALALEQGYFTIPREIVTDELAAQLDISDQAVTERIRRGITNVLTHILIMPDTDTDR